MMNGDIPTCLACKYCNSNEGSPHCSILMTHGIRPWEKIERLKKECLMLTENHESYRKNLPNRIEIKIVTENKIKSVEKIGTDEEGDAIMIIKYYKRGKRMTIWKDDFDPERMIEIEKKQSKKKQGKKVRGFGGKFK